MEECDLREAAFIQVESQVSRTGNEFSSLGAIILLELHYYFSEELAPT